MTGAVRTIETLLSRANDAVRRSGQSSGDAPESAAEEDAAATPTLFGCTNCRRTYVTHSKSSCSKCGSDVEPVPDERELGLV